jgi:uncharacterized protein YbjT (DUF2867 family)
VGQSILVVGATGNVGSELLRQFAARGERVKALVRDREKAEAVANIAEPVFGDLNAPETLDAAFQDSERVFILSPPVAGMEAMDANAFNAAVASGVKRIVYLSNYGADQLGDEPHYLAHGRNERRLAKLDVDWTVLRPARFMAFTPFVWKSVFEKDLLLERANENAMAVCDPLDIAAVGLLALTTDGHEGQTYTLTSEDAFSSHGLADLLSTRLSRKLDVFDGDADALSKALVEFGAPKEYAIPMTNYFKSVSEGRWSVTDTVSKLLGRSPTSYAQWLDRNLPQILSTYGA